MTLKPQTVIEIDVPLNKLKTFPRNARKAPHSQAAMEALAVWPETKRFKVVDIWTGETAIIAMTPQQHMSEEDALHMARLLNRSVKDGDRSVRR